MNSLHDIDFAIDVIATLHLASMDLLMKIQVHDAKYIKGNLQLPMGWKTPCNLCETTLSIKNINRSLLSLYTSSESRPQKGTHTKVERSEERSSKREERREMITCLALAKSPPSNYQRSSNKELKQQGYAAALPRNKYEANQIVPEKGAQNSKPETLQIGRSEWSRIIRSKPQSRTEKPGRMWIIIDHKP